MQQRYNLYNYTCTTSLCVLSIIIVPSVYAAIIFFHTHVLYPIMPNSLIELLSTTVIKVAIHIIYAIYVNKVIIQHQNIDGIQIFCLCTVIMLWYKLLLLHYMHSLYLMHIIVKEATLALLTYALKYLIVYNRMHKLYVSQYLHYTPYIGMINVRFIASTIMILSNLCLNGLFGPQITHITEPVTQAAFMYIIFESCSYYLRDKHCSMYTLLFTLCIILENRMLY